MLFPPHACQFLGPLTACKSTLDEHLAPNNQLPTPVEGPSPSSAVDWTQSELEEDERAELLYDSDPHADSPDSGTPCNPAENPTPLAIAPATQLSIAEPPATDTTVQYNAYVNVDVPQLDVPKGNKKKTPVMKVSTYTYGPAVIPLSAKFRALLAAIASLDGLECPVEGISTATMKWKPFKPANAKILPLTSEAGMEVLRTTLQAQLKREAHVVPCVYIFMDPPSRPKPKVNCELFYYE